MPFAPANVAKSQVLDSLTARGSALQTLGTAVQMDGALQSAYATLEDPQLADVYRKAVLVIGNRGFDSNACTSKTPAVLAGTAHTDKKIDTYVVLLARDNTLPAETVLPGLSELAAQGGTDGAYDARKDKTIAQDAFQRIVNDLATCAYEVSTASDRPVAGDVLGYSNPINPATVAVPFDTACTSQNGAGSNGWGLDPSNDKRLYLCGSACSDYRNTVRTAALYAAQTLQPAIAVPIFANKKDCVPPSTP